MAVLFCVFASLASASEVEIARDVTYGDDPVLQSLDLYRVAGASQLPILVFIHGGGWSEGDKGRHPRKGEFFAREGFLYVTMNYRLSPKVTHPAHVEDVATALAWIHRNAASYGGDASRVFLLGHSAGAHLAALVVTDPRHLKAQGLAPDLVDGVVLLDGSGYDVAERMKGARGWSRAMFRTAFGDDPEVWKDASPALHVKGGRTPPPVLLFHISGQVPSAKQARAFADVLQSAGGRAEVVEVKNRDHVTINRRLGLPGDPVTARMLTFLRELSPAR
ncbi:MAG: alpha/beta hydrolase [Myxococcaceae bacterium]